MMEQNNLAVFVDSYDGNSDLWDNVFSVMEYFWPKCMFNKYLVTNTISYSKHDVESLLVGDRTDWLYCTLTGLKMIHEKYIFFMFEDYYFSKPINNNDILHIIEIMEINKTFFYRLSPINGMNQTKIYESVHDRFPYAINLQPAIWDRRMLINYLEDMQTKGVSTPWQFEYYFIDLMKKRHLPADNGYLRGVLYDTRDIMGYKNAIIQGKWVRKVIKYYKENTPIQIDLGNRELMSFREEFWDMAKQFGHRIISYENREKIKPILKRLHFKFMR